MLETINTTNYLIPSNFLLLTSIFFLAIFLRYIILAGAIQYLSYSLTKKLYYRRTLNTSEVRSKQIAKEIYYSGITSLIFSVTGSLIVIAWKQGNTQLYTDIQYLPLWYLPVSLALSMFIHETYYYWLHRWMHKSYIYRSMHKTHHDSINTSAFTSFSFHPLESIAQAIVIPGLIFFLPMHISILAILLIIMTVSAIINHLGIEFYPNGFHKHWIGKWLIGATHHNLHHKKFRCNYGLYFTFWDKWMKTESEDYKIDIH